MARILPLIIISAILALNICVKTEAAEVGYGDPCDAENTCNSAAFLECDTLDSKTCVCKNADRTQYDNDDKVCKLKLHQVCNTEKGAQDCQTFSFCEASPTEIGVSRCECETFFAVESRGQCILKYNESCELENEIGKCDTESFMKCDENNRCTCDTSANKDAWYEFATKSCKILQGDTCNPGENEQKCVEFATCTEGDSTPGVHSCLCSNGVDRKTFNGQCVSYYGEECETQSSAICKEKDYLTCTKNKCACAGENARYDKESGLCTLVAGSKCQTNGQSCVPRASCSKNGICTCAEGLSPSKDKQCFLAHGADCRASPRGWKCDNANDMICDSKTKTCACNSPSRLHFEDGICKLKAAEKCDPVSPSAKPCIKNSKCGLESSGKQNECICNEPLVSGYSYLCIRKHNFTCGAEQVGDCDADSFHKCIDGRCACTDPDNMIVEGYRELCGLKMKASCKKGEGNPSCADTLTCEADGKCGCDKTLNLEDNGLGKCKKLHGTKCDTEDFPNGLCDTDNYLMCNGAKCVCDDSHRTKEEGKGKPCVGNVNAYCRTDANCNSDKDLVCIEGKCKSGAVNFYLNIKLIVLATAFATFSKLYAY